MRLRQRNFYIVWCDLKEKMFPDLFPFLLLRANTDWNMTWNLNSFLLYLILLDGTSIGVRGMCLKAVAHGPIICIYR